MDGWKGKGKGAIQIKKKKKKCKSAPSYPSSERGMCLVLLLRMGRGREERYAGVDAEAE